jgi:LysR family glycine cleavage system transcriptional activator
MRKLPPLSSLRAFEAAARRMSFKDAAEELGVTPTAISHQVRLLEEICGKRLFQRRPRPLALTPDGERLFPTLRNGFDAFASAIASLSAPAQEKPLRLTAPLAFASRWLVPRIGEWRALRSDVPLEVIGSDSVLDLRAGDCDFAVRYSRSLPRDLAGEEIARDRFGPTCSPELLGADPARNPADLIRYPLIHFNWLRWDPEAPTWRLWLEAAQAGGHEISDHVPATRPCDLVFREEMHAIDAVVAGQGIGILSDVVVSHELKRGKLVRAHDLTLPGYGFYVVHVPRHPRQAVIREFAAWAKSAL